MKMGSVYFFRLISLRGKKKKGWGRGVVTLFFFAFTNE